jgi:UDPglucose 6-dehydrogenase
MDQDSQPSVVVVGAGYVGLVTAVALARVRPVALVDRDPAALAELQRGCVPIREEGLQERYEAARDRLSLYSSATEAIDAGRRTLVFVAVGTPTLEDDRPGGGEAADLEQVEGVIEELLDSEGIGVVMKSTVPPKTGMQIISRLRAAGRDLHYLSCPEFLQEGVALRGVDEPDRIVVGHDGQSWASEALLELHRELYPELRNSTPFPEYIETDPTSAELIKMFSNLFLGMRISFANEAANACEQLDAKADDVLRGVGSDHRIGRAFLRPGPGFGGSCLGKDIRALRSSAADAGAEILIADPVLEVNERQRRRQVEKLAERLGDLCDKRVALLGLTFKPDTDDIRDSPVFAIAEHLLKCGCLVTAYDPDAKARISAELKWGVYPQVVDDPYNALTEADAAVIVTGWQEFRKIDWELAASAMTGKLVLDAPNLMEPEEIVRLREAGLEYEATGRQSAGLGRATAAEG